MENHKVNPILAYVTKILFSKIIYPTVEYQKENIQNNSYIFAPNHTNNLDGYLIWSLLNDKYDCDTFMYKEFWDNYPFLARFMPLFNVYPISRDKVVLSEIKNELKKLKDEKHSLIIFPQGRHVNPEVMVNFKSEHLKTIPLGAFYFSSLSSKPIIPIYMESQRKFSRNVVIYGNPINPSKYAKSSQKLELMANDWLTEINKLYILAQNLEKRKMHPYKLRDNYFDASGLHAKLNDPNIIVNYLDEIEKLKQLSIKEGITDINILGNQLGLSKKDIDIINDVKHTYEKYLVKR